MLAAVVATVLRLRRIELESAMKRHALFIGIDRYEDSQINPLACAESDAIHLHGFFTQRLGYDKTEHLLSPSADEILDTVDRLVDPLEPDDLFVFFFAGHGILHERRDLLLSAKVRHARLKHLQQVIPVDLLLEETARPGLHRVFLLDACRSNLLRDRQAGADGFAGLAATRDIVPNNAETGLAETGSLVVISSCEKGKQAREIPKKKRGLFALALQSVLDLAVRERRAAAPDDELIVAVATQMDSLACTHGLPRRQRPSREMVVGKAPMLVPGRRDEGPVSQSVGATDTNHGFNQPPSPLPKEMPDVSVAETRVWPKSEGDASGNLLPQPSDVHQIPTTVKLVTVEEYHEFISSGAYDLSSGTRRAKYTRARLQQIWTTPGLTWLESLPESDRLPTVPPKTDRSTSRNPVSGISWYEAVAYCNWRTLQSSEKRKSGTEDQLVFYENGDIHLNNSGYRLLSETEIRAGWKGGQIDKLGSPVLAEWGLGCYQGEEIYGEGRHGKVGPVERTVLSWLPRRWLRAGKHPALRDATVAFRCACNLARA